MGKAAEMAVCASSRRRLLAEEKAKAIGLSNLSQHEAL
jgi:hypothetical protein